jgi:cell division control protein 6
MAKSRVFHDEAVLEIGWVPPYLPHREKILNDMKNYLSSPAKHGVPSHILLTGDIGTGKSITAKKSVIELSLQVTHLGKDLRWIAINCNDSRSSHSILIKILRFLEVTLPSRPIDVGELLDILAEKLKEGNTHLILILDEVEEHIKSEGSRFIHAITRFSENYFPWSKVKKYAGISLILTSREQVLESLSEQALSSFGHHYIQFEPYTSHELLDIIEQRVKFAFLPGIITHDTCKLLGDLVSETGDARLAIEILFQSGKSAEAEFRNITPEDIRKNFANASPSSRSVESNISFLNKIERIALKGITKEMKNQAYLDYDSLKEAYKLACELEGEEPSEDLDRILQIIEDNGFIEWKKDEGLIYLRVPAEGVENLLKRALGESSQESKKMGEGTLDFFY